MPILLKMSRKRSSYDQLFLKYEKASFWRFLRFLASFLWVNLTKWKISIESAHSAQNEWWKKFMRTVVAEIWKMRLLGGFWRFYEKRVLPSLITGHIRNQDHKIDRKKLVPKIPSKIDTCVSLPLVYNTEAKFSGIKILPLVLIAFLKSTRKTW